MTLNLRAERDDWKARAEAAERRADDIGRLGKEHVEQLREILENMEKNLEFTKGEHAVERAELTRQCDLLRAERDKAISEAAALRADLKLTEAQRDVALKGAADLRAEVERLQVEIARWEAAGNKAAAQSNELLGMAERGNWYLQQLATANALLRECDPIPSESDWWDRRDAHLASATGAGSDDCDLEVGLSESLSETNAKLAAANELLRDAPRFRQGRLWEDWYARRDAHLANDTGAEHEKRKLHFAARYKSPVPPPEPHFAELEGVRLKSASHSPLEPGVVGTIVHVHYPIDAQSAYEVEFTDDDGKTLAVLTLRADEIESV